MKIAIVMSYYNRQKQLDHTMVSLMASSVVPHIVIVDDASDKGPMLHECWRNRPRWTRLATLSHEKFWTSVPAIPFNRGIQAALDWGADAIVLQSPECLHVGDVLAHVRDNCCKGVYTVFACLSLSQPDTFDPWIMERIDDVGRFFSRATHSNAGTGWFVHSVHRPSHLEFCAAIHRDDIIALNGYDERFAAGVACGDCDLLRRVKNLGLKLEIVDDPFVVHQWHYDGKNPYDDVEGHKRNQDLLASLELETGYRAVHTHTGDLR